MFRNTYEKNYYSSIFYMPVWNFHRCLSGDLKAAHLSGKYQESHAAKCWRRVYDEYLLEFGVPEIYLNYLKKMIQAATKYDSVFNKGRDFEFMKAFVLQKEAEKELKSYENSNESISTTAAKLSQHLGFHIDIKTITVSEFYSYLKSTDGQRQTKI